MRESGDKIACITAYDASFAHLVDVAGVDVVLVGDSLGMVMLYLLVGRYPLPARTARSGRGRHWTRSAGQRATVL
mgnify:CR=1 FL=1